MSSAAPVGDDLGFEAMIDRYRSGAPQGGLDESDRALLAQRHDAQRRLKLAQAAARDREFGDVWLPIASLQLPAFVLDAAIRDSDFAVAQEQPSTEQLVGRASRVEHWRRALELLGTQGEQRVADSASVVLPPAAMARGSFAADGYEFELSAAGLLAPVGRQLSMASMYILRSEMPRSRSGDALSPSRMAWSSSYEALEQARGRLLDGMLEQGSFDGKDIARIRLGMMYGRPAYGYGLYSALQTVRANSDAWRCMTDPDLTALTSVVIRYGVVCPAREGGGGCAWREIVVPHPDLPILELDAARPAAEPSKPVGRAARWLLGRKPEQLPDPAATAYQHRSAGDELQWWRGVKYLVDYDADTREVRAYVQHPAVQAEMKAWRDAALPDLLQRYGRIRGLFGALDAGQLVLGPVS